MSPGPPQPHSATGFPGSRHLPLALAALALLPAAFSLWNEVQEVDPAQYADVASRMLRTGEFFVTRDTYGPHINKPPLMMWAEAAGMAVFGFDSFAVRLPAFLFGLLATLGVFLVGRALRDARLGALAACLFAASVAVHQMILDPKVDMALTAMTTLAVWAVIASRERPRLIWAAWAFAGLAVLSKGPLGVGIPFLALAPEALRRDFRSVPMSFMRRAVALRPLGGLLVVAALVTPFYWAMARANGSGAAWHLLWGQGFGRLLGKSDWVGNTTPLFFLHTGLWAFLPATPLLVAALWRRLRGFLDRRALPASVERVPLWWLALPLLALSVPSYKLPQYIYCLMPAAALLSAQELLALPETAHRWWRVGFGVLAAGAAALCVVVLLVAFPGSPLRLAGWCAAVVGLPLAAAVVARRLPLAEGTALRAVAALSGFFLFFHADLQRSLLEYQPSREIAALVRREDPGGKLLAYYMASATSSTSYYAQRDCTYLEAVELPPLVKANQLSLAVVGDPGLEPLRAAGLDYTLLGRFGSYNTSTPHADFLNAATRVQTLEWLNLVRLVPRATPP